MHRTVSGLQGPRVNLTFRWVAQHIASCPLAGVVGCVLSSCAQGLAEPDSRGLGVGESKWISFWGLVLLLSILVFYFLVNTWIRIRRRRRNSSRRLSCLAVHFSSRGPASKVGGRRLRLSRRCHFPKRRSFYFPLNYFRRSKLCSFYKGYGLLFLYAADHQLHHHLHHHLHHQHHHLHRSTSVVILSQVALLLKRFLVAVLDDRKRR